MSPPGGKDKKKASASAKDEPPEPATLQSLDDKLNTILGLLEKNTSDIDAIKKEQVDLGTSLELCHNNITDLKNMFIDQGEQISSCENELQKVVENNVKLNQEISTLKNEIRTLEQYSHRNNLLIYGIPEETGENIFGVIRRLASALQFQDWFDNLIDAVHRLGQPTSSGPRPIIIKFVSRQDKEEFWRKRKVRRNLCAKDLGYSSENRIYINESLTSANRELLKITRDAAKQKNYAYVWTYNCTIFVRKEKGKSPAMKILSPRDVDKM